MPHPASTATAHIAAGRRNRLSEDLSRCERIGGHSFHNAHVTGPRTSPVNAASLSQAMESIRLPVRRLFRRNTNNRSGHATRAGQQDPDSPAIGPDIATVPGEFSIRCQVPAKSACPPSDPITPRQCGTATTRAVSGAAGTTPALPGRQSAPPAVRWSGTLDVTVVSTTPNLAPAGRRPSTSPHSPFRTHRRTLARATTGHNHGKSIRHRLPAHSRSPNIYCVLSEGSL